MSAVEPVEQPKLPVTIEQKKTALQSCLYKLLMNNPFLGALLQEVTVRYSLLLPTAGITFNKKTKQFDIMLNDHFFTEMPLLERVAVMEHEILHFLHHHLFRLPFLAEGVPAEKKKVFNIAADMAINQLINNLPANCINFLDFKLKDGTTFPPLKTMEEYYQLLEENKEMNKDKMPGGKDQQDPLDSHGWDELTPEEKEQFLGEAKNLLTRTIEKTSTSYDKLPQFIKDLLQRCETELASINYKKILREAIRKNASCADRETTWTRPNKRYGAVAQGSRLGKLPKLDFLVDTSGSISTRELNEFLAVMDQFLKVGTRTCKLSLWHTSLYYNKSYRLGLQLDENEVQSGGTDISDAVEYIKKHRPDLSIILTDGYYDHPDTPLTGEVVFIISKGGNMSHPLAHIGKTISMDKLVA